MKNGFSLVEMAMVLLILSLLLGSLLPTFSVQREAQYRQQAKEKLEEIKEALLGYAIVYGELPCPTIPNNDGKEKRIGGGGTACKEQHGFVPAVTLGLSGVFNDDDLLIDPWGNPYRYSVSIVSGVSSPSPSYCSTTIETHTLVSKELILKNRFECIESTIDVYNNITKTTDTMIADKLPIILYSLGSESRETPSTEEEENIDTTLDGYAVSSDNIFIISDKKDFNHIFTWISPHILYNRMIASGVY